MNRRLGSDLTRTLALAGWLLAAASLVALGTLWAIDRTRPRATPRWEAAAFESLHLAPGAAEGWRERWVVAVYPGCPHCRASLAALAAARDRSQAAVRVTALVVDVTESPASAALAAMPADEVCWDPRQVWRQHWRQRVYGETFCFDSTGALLRELAPFASLDDALDALATSHLTGAL